MNDDMDNHLPQFFTATILKWQNLLSDDVRKDIIINSLRFLTEQKRIIVFGFVIMPNHIHLIWQVTRDYQISDVQRDFLKFTSQQFLKLLRKSETGELNKYYVGLNDRKYQIWQRNSLSKDLYSETFFNQKLDYIHHNPCQPKWGLAQHPEDYYYSSALFYNLGTDSFGMLKHHEGS